MSILHVVQPDEFDGNSFEVIDGKLQPKISLASDNILKLTVDGLYATGASADSVGSRYRYDVRMDGIGSFTHNGIVFNLRYSEENILMVDINGQNGDELTEHDIVYHNGQSYGPNYDGGSYTLSSPFVLSMVQRVTLVLHRNPESQEIWVLHTLLASASDVVVIIDEMVTLGTPNFNLGDDQGTGGTDPEESTGDENLSAITYVSSTLSGNPPFLLMAGDGENLYGIGIDSNNQPDTENYIFAATVSDINGFDSKAPIVVDDAYGIVAVKNDRGEITLYNRVTEELRENCLPNNLMTEDDTLQLGAVEDGRVLVGFTNAASLLYFQDLNAPIGRTFNPKIPNGSTVLVATLTANNYNLVVKNSSGVSLLTYNIDGPDSQQPRTTLLTTDTTAYEARIYSVCITLTAVKVSTDTGDVWHVFGINPVGGNTVSAGPLLTPFLEYTTTAHYNKFVIDEDDYSVKALFVDVENFSIHTLKVDLISGTLSSTNSTVPQAYLDVAMTGLVTRFFPIGYLFCFQSDATGKTLLTVPLDGTSANVREEVVALLGPSGEGLLMAGENFIHAYGNGSDIGGDSYSLQRVDDTAINPEHTTVLVNERRFAYLAADDTIRLAMPNAEGFEEINLGHYSDISSQNSKLALTEVDGVVYVGVFNGVDAKVVVRTYDPVTEDIGEKDIILDNLAAIFNIEAGSSYNDFIYFGATGKFAVFALPQTVVGDASVTRSLLVVDLITGESTINAYTGKHVVDFHAMELYGLPGNKFITRLATSFESNHDTEGYEFALWSIAEDRTTSLLDTLTTFNTYTFVKPYPIYTTLERVHNVYFSVFTDDTPNVFIDIVADLVNNKLSAETLEITPELTEAGGIYLSNIVPIMTLFRDPDGSGYLTEAFIQSSPKRDSIQSFGVNFTPLATTGT